MLIQGTRHCGGIPKAAVETSSHIIIGGSFAETENDNKITCNSEAPQYNNKARELTQTQLDTHQQQGLMGRLL
jgi:hypothetical protein